MLPDQMCQCGSVNMSHDQEGDTGSLAHQMNRDDVEVIETASGSCFEGKVHAREHQLLTRHASPLPDGVFRNVPREHSLRLNISDADHLDRAIRAEVVRELRRNVGKLAFALQKGLHNARGEL